MAGREAGGPETYEHGLVRSLAEIDKKNEYHLFCLQDHAAQSFGIVQDNVTYHVLRPNFRWISIPFGLPLAMMRSGVDILHVHVRPRRRTAPENIFLPFTASICSRTRNFIRQWCAGG